MKTLILLATFAISNIALPVWSADSTVTHDMSQMNMNPTRDDREKMAKNHEQMGTCLRSDQDFKVCHEVFHTECKAMMGGSCYGMNMGKKMHKGTKK
jgi:hypothetical protein